MLDTSCAALLALSREVRAQGYKVVLTGEGADEAFAGYVWYKIREIARRLDVGDAFRPSTAISRVARKWAARDQSFAELARIDGMIGGPHAQSILYNLVARSRGRYYSAGMKEEIGAHVAYEDLDLDYGTHGALASAEPLALSRLQGSSVGAAVEPRRATAWQWRTAWRRATRSSMRT